jgi:hypothetical protein
MVIPNGDSWAAAFLRSEPQYTEASWIDAYAMSIGACKPELIPEAAVQRARDAFAREGSWNNPKVAAGMDAVLGPL